MDKKEKLNKVLLLKINQYKMLNNSLEKVLKNSGDETLISGIKKEIDNTLNEIKEIKIELNAKEEEVNYSFYDSINKPNVYKSERIEKTKNEDLDNVKYEKTLVNEVNENEDMVAFSNRFLVELEELVEIPSEMVKAVSFDPSMNHLVLNIYDFVKDVEGVKYPILGLLKYAPERFDFSINHFDATSKVMYVEKYHNAQIYEYYRDGLSYASSDPSMIQIHIVYESVTYETNN